MIMIEIEFEDRVILIPLEGLTKIQALWKGAIVRKHFKQIKNAYEAVFKDIEGPDCCDLQWTTGLISKPIVPKKKTYYSRSAAQFKSQENLSEQKIDAKENQKQISSEPSKSNEKNNDKPLACQCQGYQTKKEDVPKNKKSQIDNLNEPKSHQSSENTHSDNNMSVETTSDKNDVKSDCKSDKKLHCKGKGSILDATKDQTMLSTANQTSIWDSELSDDLASQIESYKGMDKSSLEAIKTSTVMELLWVQQAITSRKQYLNLMKNTGEAT